MNTPTRPDTHHHQQSSHHTDYRSPKPEVPQPKPKTISLRLPAFRLKWLLLLILILLLAIGINIYEHRGGEAGILTRQLSPYFQLPNEKPSIATVTNKSKLANQKFFAQAQNGDKLIIYTNAHKIILYRPSIGKVVDIAPIQQTY